MISDLLIKNNKISTNCGFKVDVVMEISIKPQTYESKVLFIKVIRWDNHFSSKLLTLLACLSE